MLIQYHLFPQAEENWGGGVWGREGGRREKWGGEGSTRPTYSAINEGALLIFPGPISFKPQEITLSFCCCGVYSLQHFQIVWSFPVVLPRSALSSLGHAWVPQQSVALDGALRRTRGGVPPALGLCAQSVAHPQWTSSPCVGFLQLCSCLSWAVCSSKCRCSVPAKFSRSLMYDYSWLLKQF